jgi:hypothetical protein
LAAWQVHGQSPVLAISTSADARLAIDLERAELERLGAPFPSPELAPERDELLRALPDLKERLRLNVELAAPVDFIPVRRDWEDRSPFIAQEGRLSFHHFDYCAQALAKIERGHDQDAIDVANFLTMGLIGREELAAYFEAIAPELYRYPAIDPAAFRQRVERVLGDSA